MFGVPHPSLGLYQHVPSLLLAECACLRVLLELSSLVMDFSSDGRVARESVFLYGNQGNSNMPLYGPNKDSSFVLPLQKEMKGGLANVHFVKGKENNTGPVFYQ